jgi:hypothetical protein
MAMSVAFGTKFLGDTEPAKRGNVVIVDGEGGRSRAIRRFNRLALARGINADPDRDAATAPGEIYWYSPDDLSLSADDAAAQLSRLLGPLNPVLVILDTLAKVMGVTDENSNAAASRVTKALYTLNRELDAALLVLAHPAKTESGDATVRGAGELSADLDVLWHIQKSHGRVHTIRCEKDRDADLDSVRFAFSILDAEETTRLERRERARTTQERVEAVIADTLESSPQGTTRNEIVATVAAALGFGRTKALDAVRDMLASGRIIQKCHRLFMPD